MKKLIFILLLTMLCIPDLFCYELPIIVYPRQIKFNNGLTNGAVNIRKNVSEDIPVPEYIHESTNGKFAYVKNASNRQIQASIYSNCSPIDLDIQALDNANTGPGDIAQFSVDTYVPVADNYITMTASGNVPNSVGIRTFTWLWALHAVNSYGVYPYENDVDVVEYTTHTYYTLYGTPQAPMTEPWTDALDYACSWASGENSETGIATDITINTFNCGKFFYEPRTHYASGAFYISSMLAMGVHPTNCTDLASFVYVLSRTLGCGSVKLKKINGTFGLKQNNIKLISSEWGGPSEFNYHDIVYKSNVYDPTLMLRGSDGVNERVPVNEALNGSYKDDLYWYDTWDPQADRDYFATLY